MTSTLLNQCLNIALNNNHQFHMIAVLLRNKSIMYIGTNIPKTHPKFRKVYKNGKIGYHLHAETSVIRFAKPGDKLIILRFLKNGNLTMAYPCEDCQKHILRSGIRKVTYTDWQGNFQTYKVQNDI